MQGPILKIQLWQYYDNIMAILWQYYDNIMTILWQYDDNIMKSVVMANAKKPS